MKNPPAAFRLCYVDRPWAYFTTQSLDRQSGEKWNVAPYEHNAGRPEEWEDARDGEPWEIYCVAWEGPFALPCDPHLNSPYTVRGINDGEKPWMDREEWPPGEPVRIMAGTSLLDFIDAVHRGGGRVYMPLDAGED